MSLQPNEATFQRSPHNKQNPYVMISREMAQDKSISPKAKGVLLYLLSLPDNWKIHHSHLQDALGVGEDYINSSMDELLQNGYAERTREKVKGLYQPYQYKIYEFKISLPDGENRPGPTGPENPGIQSKYSPNGEEKKQQQTAAPPVAVFSESENEDLTKPVMWYSLREIELPLHDKYEITKRYDEDTVNNAIAWATHPDTVITKTLAAAIKWACQNKPEVPKNKEESESLNKAYAFRYDGVKSRVAEIVCCNKHVEIVHGGAASTGVFLNYDSKDFMVVFKEALKTNHFKVLEWQEKSLER